MPFSESEFNRFGWRFAGTSSSPAPSQSKRAPEPFGPEVISSRYVIPLRIVMLQ